MIFLIWIEEGGRRDMLKGIIVREEEDLPCVGARTGRDLSVRAEVRGNLRAGGDLRARRDLRGVEDLLCWGLGGRDLSVRAEDFEGKFEGWWGFEGRKRFA
jgi:hypothetical protein